MAILETKNLTKRFGGFTAIDEVNYKLEPGEIASIIGPNGAGKTTFFNLITGEFPPTSGSVWLQGDEISALDPNERVHRGMTRVFQISNLFPSLTTFEHIRLGIQATQGEGTSSWLQPAAANAEIREATYDLLDELSILEEAETKADSLPHGDKRKLEIGMALAADPDVLLMDEPAGGLPDKEVYEIMEFIREIASDHTIILVEHKMNVVMGLSDRVSVLHNGQLIADGTVDEVRSDDRVQSVYLGEEHA